MFCWLIVSLIGTILYLLPKHKPFAGIYSRPDASSLNLELARNERGGYGVKAVQDLGQMEKAQPLSQHPLAIDAVLMSCSGEDGTYLVAAEARRQLRMNNTIFCLKIPSVGVLLHPKHPDTTFFTETETSWDAEGLKIELVTPMQEWRVSYEGPVVSQSSGKVHQLKLESKYISTLPHFDFDGDMDEWTIARAMAKEEWSQEYFERIRKAHQCHYEQFGDLVGTATIDGKTFNLNLNVMRDHTHGSTRDWRLMHRYCLHNFRTKTGLRGFVGIVSQPSTFSTLELGYIYTPQGNCLPVQEVDLPLWQHGENGADPKDFGFRFKAGGKWYEVQYRVTDTVEIFIGWQWEARILERFCVVTVDGVPGWGVSEWHYKHNGGRPKRFEDTDPEHTKNVEKY